METEQNATVVQESGPSYHLFLRVGQFCCMIGFCCMEVKNVDSSLFAVILIKSIHKVDMAEGAYMHNVAFVKELAS